MSGLHFCLFCRRVFDLSPALGDVGFTLLPVCRRVFDILPALGDVGFTLLPVCRRVFDILPAWGDVGIGFLLLLAMMPLLWTTAKSKNYL